PGHEKCAALPLAAGETAEGVGRQVRPGVADEYLARDVQGQCCPDGFGGAAAALGGHAFGWQTDAAQFRLEQVAPGPQPFLPPAELAARQRFVDETVRLQ